MPIPFPRRRRSAPLSRAARPAGVLVAWLATLAHAGAAQAQTRPDTLPARDSVRVLEPLTVTAQRELAAPPPVATLRLDAAAVQRTPAANPYDLVRRTAGLEVHEQGQGPGFASDVVIRGFTSDHSGDVLLVVDGVPVNLPISGHGEGYADWNTLFPAAISSFRVIHGAASPLYGDFALGGVAEVFTAADAAGTGGAVQSSSQGDAAGWLVGGHRGEGGGFLAGAEGQRMQGWRENSDYRRGNGLLRGWRRLGSGRLEGGLSLYATRWNSPGFLSLDDFDAGRLHQAMDLSDGGDAWRGVVQGRYAGSLGSRAALQASAWGLLSRWTLFLTIPEEDEELAQTGEHDRRSGAGAQLQVVWTLPQGELTLGGEGRMDAASFDLSHTRQRVVNEEEADLDARHQAGALFGRWRRTFAGRLGLDLGARLDAVRHASLDRLEAAPEWEQATRLIASPKLGARYRLGEGTWLRASSSRGFRSSVGVAGDPGRPPLLAWAHEAGADLVRGPLQASLALFRLDVANERVVDPVTREITSAGSSLRQGVDVDTRLRLARGVFARGAATWNDARLTGKYADAHQDHPDSLGAAASEGPRLAEEGGHDEALEGQRVPGVARYHGRLGVEVEAGPRLQARAGWRFTGPYVPIGEPGIRTRGWSVLDLGASLPLGRRLAMDAEMQNLLDRQYPELRASGYVAPGTPRTLRIALRLDPGAI